MTPTTPSDSPGDARGAAATRAGGVWTADLVITVALLVVTGALALVAAFFGMFTGMVSDGCYGDELCASRVGTGTLINVVAPAVCWIAALVVCVRRTTRRRSAWWVPLVAVVVWFFLVLIGAAVATSAMPS